MKSQQISSINNEHKGLWALRDVPQSAILVWSEALHHCRGQSDVWTNTYRSRHKYTKQQWTICYSMALQTILLSGTLGLSVYT